jgi:hypothetical protein
MHNRWVEFQVDTEKRIGVSRLHSQATKLKTNMGQVAIRHQRKLEAHTLQQARTLLAAEKARVEKTVTIGYAPPTAETLGAVSVRFLKHQSARLTLIPTREKKAFSTRA